MIKTLNLLNFWTVLKPCLDLMMSFKNCIRIRIAIFWRPVNELPNHVISSPKVNQFKSYQDKHMKWRWSHPSSRNRLCYQNHLYLFIFILIILINEYSWDQKSLGKHTLNNKKTCWYCIIVFLAFKICLPKDFWSQLYILSN